jgi:hypothetical protein
MEPLLKQSNKKSLRAGWNEYIEKRGVFSATDVLVPCSRVIVIEHCTLLSNFYIYLHLKFTLYNPFLGLKNDENIF